ncbi:MAG: hypothetical protein ACLQU3_06465 [Limisphaerales bacterium]
MTAAGVHALRDEYTRTIEPARARAAETLILERTLSDLVNQAYALTPERGKGSVDWNSSWAHGSRALAVLRWSWL